MLSVQRVKLFLMSPKELNKRQKTISLTCCFSDILRMCASLIVACFAMTSLSSWRVRFTDSLHWAPHQHRNTVLGVESASMATTPT